MTKKGSLFVVGIGPGEYEAMTLKAVRTLESCEVIVGYTVYVELIERHFPGRRFCTTPMRQETMRCRLAFEEAGLGQRVAVICSGDAGVYGMAGLVLELSREYPNVNVEIVPGVTAAMSGAALLGAPLMHDFAVIRLSDLLTLWEKIEKLLRSAADADFVICLYNPASRKRADYLAKACEILLEYKSPDTVCGVVKCVGREGEERRIMRLGRLGAYEADMFTTVFIGSSQTAKIQESEGNGNGWPWMVTPRGYQI